MIHAPHHDENHAAITDADDDDDDSGTQNSIPLADNLERYSNRGVVPSAPYSVSNAAPNFLDLFTTSHAPPVI